MAKSTITMVCEYCGREFEAKRKAARYCSNACRTKAYRKRHGIPFPDFSKIVTSKMPSEKEHKIMVLHDEINSVMLEEKALEKSYKIMYGKLEQALRAYEANPNNWGRENTNRRKQEFNEVKHMLTEVQRRRLRLEKSISDVQKGIDREELEQKQLIMSAEEILSLQFSVLDFTGDWLDLFGRPSNNFLMIVSGPPKGGKSTFALQFANYLKKFGSVVYIAVYEKFSLSLQRKIVKNKISGIDFSKARIKKEIDYVIRKGHYDFVFIDSAGQAFLRISDFEELKAKYPTTSFVTIYQVSDEDDRKITDKIKQRSDIIVDVDAGIAHARGRFNPSGEYEIFEHWK